MRCDVAPRAGGGSIALGLFATMYRELTAHAVVDCLGESAERFYRHQGFETLDGVVGGPEARKRMFLSMRDVLALFGMT